MRGEEEMMERICVVGLGRVGLPILEMLRGEGFEAVGYDHNRELTQVTADAAVHNSDAAIFIVQTPSLPDGSFSNEFLLKALTEFKVHTDIQKKKDYLYIVTSTTVPGSCDGFRSIVGDMICYKPEFIRLEHVRVDLLTPAMILIGEGCPEAGDRCEAIFRRVSDSPVRRMSLIEAELAKITLNCALTMKISLANQLHLVAEKLGADSEKIMDAVGLDPRIGAEYLKPGRPYAGPCLPRDNQMFRFVAESVGVNAALSWAADKINEAVRGE